MDALLLTPNAATWGIAALARLGVIVRPFSWPEAVWAAGGALLLVILGLLPAGRAHSIDDPTAEDATVTAALLYPSSWSPAPFRRSAMP